MTQLADHNAISRMLAVPSAIVAVLDTGPTAQPARGTVLLVPGYTGSKEDFAPILDDLAGAGHRVVAMDQPGQHESPGPDDRAVYTVDWLGAVVNEVAVHLHDGEPVHLLGHSFGGLVARAAVLAEPKRYRSLTLLCSGPSAIGGARRERMQRLEPFLTQGMPALYAAMEVEAESTGDPRWAATPPAVRGFLRERFLKSSLAGLFGMGDAIRAEPDLVEELAATGVPAMVCFGRDDDAWAPAAQREMALRLGAELAVIDGAAHSPAVEQPAATVAALAAFWAAR